MTKLRLLSLIIAITLVISTIPCCMFASAESEPVSVTLSMYSNLSDKKSISGLYKENTFYVSIDNLCEISGAKVEKTENNSVFLSLNQGIRNFEIITTGGGLMKELFYNDSYPITMPVIIRNDSVFVSAIDFLHYVGAYYKLSNASNPQFMVAMKYTIFEAISEYINSDFGNYFWWDEVDYNGKSIDNKIINAGVVALINRDSNFFRMMLDAKGIEQEALEDALISILTNEGISYFEEQNQQSDFMNLANDTLGMESDYVEFIVDFYKSDATKEFGEYLGEFASVSAHTVNHVVNVVNSIESYKQFEKITDVQRSLLADTIISYYKNSSTLSNGWENVLGAAKNVDERAKNAYSNKFAEAEKLTKKTGYDMLGNAIGFNPISVAWDGAILINKLIPYTSNVIDKKTQLYNAYNCSIIQLIADELLSEAWSKVYYSDYCGQQSTYMDYLTQVKNALILQLKSTLTTRDYLIKSEYLTEDYVAEMKAMNKETAELLNKTLNCKVIGLGEMALYSEKTDYSWIAECKGDEIATNNYYDVIEQYKKAVMNDYYKDILNGFSDEWDSVGEYVNSLLLSNSRYSEQFKTFYSLSDINNDGVHEMIIGAGENDSDVRLYDVFTYDGSKAVPLLEIGLYGERNNFEIYENGIIYTQGSGGASVSGYDYYKLKPNDSKLSFVDGYLFEDYSYYETNVNGSSKKSITREEYELGKKSHTSNAISYNWIEICMNGVQNSERTNSSNFIKQLYEAEFSVRSESGINQGYQQIVLISETKDYFTAVYSQVGKDGYTVYVSQCTSFKIEKNGETSDVKWIDGSGNEFIGTVSYHGDYICLTYKTSSVNSAIKECTGADLHIANPDSANLEPVTSVIGLTNFTSDSIWATLVNNKWVDEEGNEIRFTKNITYYKLKPNAIHTDSDYYMGTISTTNSKGYYYGHYLVKDDKELFLLYNTWPNGGMGLLLNENYCWDPSMEKNNSWCMTSDGKIMFSQGRDSFCNKTLYIIK